MRGKNKWACFLMILAGIVIGGFIGSLFPDTWLNFGKTFGMTSPFVLDIGILCLTFALSINITLAGILGIVIAIIIYHFI